MIFAHSTGDMSAGRPETSHCTVLQLIVIERSHQDGAFSRMIPDHSRALRAEQAVQ